MKHTDRYRLDRRQHREQVYAENSPLSVCWYQEKPLLSLQLIQDAALARDVPVIDVGGGASLLVDHLLDSGYTDLTVLDVAAQALGHAQQRLGEAARRIRWLACDITEFVPGRLYGLWHDRAALHFLTSAEDRQKYVAILKKAVSYGGHAILATFAPGGPSRCSGLDIKQYDDEKMSALLGSDFGLLQQRTETHRTPAGGARKFAYFYLRRTAKSVVRRYPAARNGA